MTRSEHMKWSKDRALEIAKSGDLAGAYASMASDLDKHPETECHQAIQLGMMLMMTGNLSSQSQMVEFIEGFN